MRTKVFTWHFLIHVPAFSIRLSLIFFSLSLVCNGQQPLLQITSPPNGSVVNPGQNLSVSVTSPAGATFAQLDVIGESPIGISTVATSVPAQFSIFIPSDIACGQYRLTAEGTTVSGQDVESASITIDVERPDFPPSLSTLLSGIFLQRPSQTTPLIVLATFSDGTVLDVSGSSYLTFSSTNTNVATVDASGIVTAVGPGTGFISATYTLGNNQAKNSVPVNFPISGGTGSTNFFISIAPGTQTIAAGTSASFTVSATSYNGFTGAIALSLGGLPSGATASFSPTSVNVSGASTLTISTLQSTPLGTYVLTITGTSGSLNPSVSVSITVSSSGSPNIASLSPTSGPVGTSVAISGANFGSTQGTSTITFNGTSATPSSWGGASIIVPVPTGATTGGVVVTVGGVASNSVSFAVTASAAPVISSLNPTSGVVGISVTITGTNFGSTQGTSTVTFNGTTASPTSWSATSIVTPVPNGATTGNVVVTVSGLASNGASFTVVPFVITGSMTTARFNHTATLLNNGLILIAGGDQGCNECSTYSSIPISSAELYNPSTGTFAVTGSLNVARTFHTSTLLNNGMVLITGGYDINGSPIASAELYNPSTGTFTVTGSVNTPRKYHPSTLLNNGMVLITGGYDISSSRLSSAELYNPSTGTFSVTGSLNTARAYHTSTLLNNGMVLIAGGYDSSGFPMSSAELYNPSTGTFTVTGNLNTGRLLHTATLLNNGMVVVAGGGDCPYATISSAELYNPSPGTFASTGSLNAAREYHTSTLLNNGKLLITGGISSSGYALSSAEMYDPSTGAFTLTGSLNVARASHTATFLNNGMVLIVGGSDSSGSPLSSAELY